MTLGNYPTLNLSEAGTKHRRALNILEHGDEPGLNKRTENLEALLSSTIDNLIQEYIEK